MKNMISREKTKEQLKEDLRKIKEELAIQKWGLEKTLRGMKVFVIELIQKKKEAEEAKARKEAIFSSIGDGLIITDDKGDIVQVNKAFEKLLGWSAKEAIGKKMLDVAQKVDENGEIIPPAKRSLSRVLAGEISAGKVSSIIKTHSYIRKDKSKLPVIGVVTPVMLNNKIIGAVQVFRDVTYELEVDRAKTEFVSVASHQLRTPLTTIKLFTEMLANEEVGKLNSAQKDYVSNARQSAERMIRLVNDLLNVSRLDAGRLKIEPKPVRLKEFIQSIIDEFALSGKEECKREIIFKKPEGELPTIQADPDLMRQAIGNLINNAVRYSPENKCNIVVTLKKREETDYLISVKDSGIGIPKEIQPKIFEKFFRADNAIKSTTDGTGLGLYTVKKIIEASGGKVWFESEGKNQGSTFYISIPITGMKMKEGEIGIVGN